MRIYLDTCVIIDYLASRVPFSEDAGKILTLVANNKIYAYISASSITDIHYILKKHFQDEQITRKYMIKVLSLIEILDTLSYNIKTVFDSPINDFEDALIEEISYQNKLSYIVTRNTKDFKNSRVKVVTPKKLLTTIKNSSRKKLFA